MEELLEIFEDLEDEDFENEVLRTRGPTRIRDRVDHFLKWDESEFFERFRMRKHTASIVLGLIRDSLRSKTNKNRSLTPELKFLCALSHACHGANPLSSKFPCRLCQAEMKDPESLSTHFASEHPDNKIFECPTCSKEMDDLKEALDHGYAHIFNSHECQICMEKLASKKDLIRHNNAVHPGVDMAVCIVCNKRYSNAAALKNHRHVHTGERLFHCPYCFATFSLKSSQQVHVRRHINYRPFPCAYCPKRFFNSGDMSKHQRIHTQEKPYKCDMCGQEFIMRETLVTHWKSHQNKKGLKCPKCPKTFNLKTQLFNHMPIHIGVKPFKCPLCEEACYHLGGIQVHLNSVHVTEEMTECEICGKTENLRYKLVQHLMTHRSDFFQSKNDWRNYLKNVKPTMKVKGKGKAKIKTTEQDIYGIIRMKRKANKLNAPVIPLMPEPDDNYRGSGVGNGNEDLDDANTEVKQVKKRRRRRKKEIVEDEINDPLNYENANTQAKPVKKRGRRKKEELVEEVYNEDPVEHDHHFMADPLAIDEQIAEIKPIAPQKKKRQRKQTLKSSNQKQDEPKQKSSRKNTPGPKTRKVRSRVNCPSKMRQQKQPIEEVFLEEDFEVEEDEELKIKEEIKIEYSDEEWMHEEKCFEPPTADIERTCGTCNETFDTADMLRNHVVVHI